MLRKYLLWGGLIGSALLLAGCAAESPSAPTKTPVGGMIRQRNEGYSLLYQLMSDESKVGQIFIIKHADEPLKSLVKQIGSAAATAKSKMDLFAHTSDRIEYDEPDLPLLEQRSRDLQAKADEHTLLSSSGKNFELELIFTQTQAMDYAAQLSKATAEHEDNADRKSFLEDLAKQCTDFHDRLMKMLTVQS